jgi:hypothetical protein
MSYYTQAKLEYVITTMLTNGRQAKAQEILVKVGGNPAMLDEGQTLLQAWITSREAVDVLYGQKIEATATEETIYKTVQAEISSLVETIYLFFNNNSAVRFAAVRECGNDSRMCFAHLNASLKRPIFSSERVMRIARDSLGS